MRSGIGILPSSTGVSRSFQCYNTSFFERQEGIWIAEDLFQVLPNFLFEIQPITHSVLEKTLTECVSCTNCLRIKREICYILPKYTCGVDRPNGKYKHIKIKPRTCVLFLFCFTWTVNANSLKQNSIVIKQICSS